jgi:hypothetical protein
VESPTGIVLTVVKPTERKGNFGFGYFDDRKSIHMTGRIDCIRDVVKGG